MERYVYEQKIKGHGTPISINKLKYFCEKAENSMCKIKYFGTTGTGFFFSTKYSKYSI